MLRLPQSAPLSRPTQRAIIITYALSLSLGVSVLIFTLTQGTGLLVAAASGGLAAGLILCLAGAVAYVVSFVLCLKGDHARGIGVGSYSLAAGLLGTLLFYSAILLV